jgi:hypothetical protein
MLKDAPALFLLGKIQFILLEDTQDPFKDQL